MHNCFLNSRAAFSLGSHGRYSCISIQRGVGLKKANPLGIIYTEGAASQTYYRISPLARQFNTMDWFAQRSEWFTHVCTVIHLHSGLHIHKKKRDPVFTGLLITPGKIKLFWAFLCAVLRFLRTDKIHMKNQCTCSIHLELFAISWFPLLKFYKLNLLFDPKYDYQYQ